MIASKRINILDAEFLYKADQVKQKLDSSSFHCGQCKKIAYIGVERIMVYRTGLKELFKQQPGSFTVVIEGLGKLIRELDALINVEKIAIEHVSVLDDVDFDDEPKLGGSGGSSGSGGMVN